VADLKPLVDWMYQEIQGIEKVLQKLAPNIRIIGGEVATFKNLPGTPEAPVQRSPNDSDRRDWAALPAMPRAVGAPPLVAPNKPFAAGLAASDAPAPILAPLSHGRSLEAPAGLVTGVARPVTASRAAELPKPVQRSPLGGRRTAVVDAEGSLEHAADVTVDGPNTVPALGAGAPPLPTIPARRLDVVAAAPRSTGKAFTSAPALPLPAPAGRVGQPRISGAGVQRSPEPAAAAVATAQPPAPAPVAASVPPPTVVADGPRLTIGQARRLGLGMPIAGGPIASGAAPFSRAAGPEAQPNAAPVPMPLRPPGSQGAQRSPEPDPASSPAPAASSSSSAIAPGQRPGPAAPAATTSGQPVLARPVAARAATVGSSSPGRTPAPIVSARPLRAGVQRSPILVQAKPAGEPAAPATTLREISAASRSNGSAEPVKVHRDGTASQLSKDLDARSFTHSGEIFLPASHGPLTSGRGKALLAHELTHVNQQRTLGSSLPQEHTPHGQKLEADAVAAERTADLPLASPAPTRDATPAPAARPDVVASNPDLSPGPANARHAHQGGASSHAQRSPASGSGGDGAGGRGHSEQELEDLARQLYSRIGRQLRRELLVDRERAGLAMEL
jgi:hypothetical protein